MFLLVKPKVEYNMAFVHERIETLLQDTHTSARSLSRNIDKNENYISKILKEKSNVQVDVISDICNAFEITWEEFFNKDIALPATYSEIYNELGRITQNNLEGFSQLLKKMKPEHYNTLVDFINSQTFIKR